MTAILGNPDEFDRMMTNYDPPIGNAKFIAALAALLRAEFGWSVGPENIAITGGGQTAFFFLFNLLAGEFQGGKRKAILLPLVPEVHRLHESGIEPWSLACGRAASGGSLRSPLQVSRRFRSNHR